MKRLVCTPAEAAEALVTSPDKVRELIQSGEIPAYREGRNFKIVISLLQVYIEERAMGETERRKNGQ